MLLFRVTTPATVPQKSEIPEGLMSFPVLTHSSATDAELKWILTKFLYHTFKRTNIINYIYVLCVILWYGVLLNARINLCLYRGADKSLARPD
jgi:hypothetical protein